VSFLQFPLHVIAQHQFARMRCEIGLPLEIGDIETSHPLSNQRQRNYQRYSLAMVLFDRFHQLPARIGTASGVNATP
jgi:hypothetical protein